MPGAILAVPGTNTIYATFPASLPKPMAEDSILWNLRYARGNRCSHLIPTGWSFQGAWYYARDGFVDDPAAPSGYVMRSGSFEPWSPPARGNATQNFILGRCVDAGAAGVSGAVVQTFLTATDALVSETTADVNGYYQAGTPNVAGTQHYIVAYRAGAPDIAGTTVNTLTPTKIDGSAP